MKNRFGWVLLFGFALLVSCSQKPDEPGFDNPFDPDGSAPGTGYGIAAVFEGDSVKITFDDPDAIESYRLYHSTTSSDFDSMDEVDADEFSFASSGGRATIGHRGFAAQSTNWYRVRGRATKIIAGAPIPVDLVPSVPVSVDLQVLGRFVSATTTTRSVTLQVLTGVADSVEVSNDADFGTATRFAVTPGSWTDIAWLLPTSAEPTRRVESFTVYFRSIDGGVAGETMSADIQKSLNAGLVFGRGLRVLPTQALVDSILVVRMSPTVATEGLVGVTVEELDSDGTVLRSFGPLVAPTDSVVISLDTANLDQRRLGGFLRSDFGDSVRIDAVAYTPATAIENARVEVVGSTVVASTSLQLAITADGAGYYALSESPDFTGLVWNPWTSAAVPSATDTVAFTLEGTPGTHRVYAAFSNPFVPEPTFASVEVDLVVPPASSGR